MKTLLKLFSLKFIASLLGLGYVTIDGEILDLELKSKKGSKNFQWINNRIENVSDE